MPVVFVLAFSPGTPQKEDQENYNPHDVYSLNLTFYLKKSVFLHWIDICFNKEKMWCWKKWFPKRILSGFDPEKGEITVLNKLIHKCIIHV